jgi:predicted ABC-type ATPase
VSSPVLHVLAGPNGSGKSSFVHAVLQPITHLRFINADEITAERWPGQESRHAYEASAAAMAARNEAFQRQDSFITETVFSHPSKVDLVRRGVLAGYIVTLHVILVPEDVTVARVEYRVETGGHSVPEAKTRERYQRLWALVAEARAFSQRAIFYDNSRAKTPFIPVAHYERGVLVPPASWPAWTPPALI